MDVRVQHIFMTVTAMRLSAQNFQPYMINNNMTSKERHEQRYQRRKVIREKKKQERNKNDPTFDDVFTYKNLYDAFGKCKRGVMWKSSVQSYRSNLPSNIYELYAQLRDSTYRSRGFEEFTINERGKKRHIKSVHISERCVQRCLCDNYLVPILSRSLIYDNGATIENKGTEFTIRRLKTHMQKHFRKYGNEGYIATLDFSDYFNSISHEKLYSIIDKKIHDRKLKGLIHHFINNFGSDGLGLGSQVSQICAVAFPDSIDHMVKDEMQIQGYGRYMDDSYIISNDLRTIKACISKIKEKCSELDIILKPNKIKIYKLSKTFTFLKKKITLTSSGKIIMRISRSTVCTERKRMKKLKGLMESGKVTYKNVIQSYLSWRNNALKYKSYRSVKTMDKLYYDLFIHPFFVGEEYGL